ncbi:hypothetical protein SRABI96_03282 [Peribacillus sp. Bi96]|nr:hypothetical protein SRABI96_03282 [Peribacillus sp. Bi96]
MFEQRRKKLTITVNRDAFSTKLWYIILAFYKKKKGCEVCLRCILKKCLPRFLL